MIISCVAICGFILTSQNYSITSVTNANKEIKTVINQGTATPANSFFPEVVNNIEKISSFRDLPEGWNGYDATPISQKLIDVVAQILTRLSRQPEIFPTGRNSIQLEYEKLNGDYLEFEIFENGVVNMYLQRGDTELEQELSVEEIFQKVVDFYE